MRKTTIRLSVALTIRDNLIKLLNSKIKDCRESKVKNKDVEEYINILSSQVDLFKVAIAKTNAHTLFFGKSNNYWIYRLSSLRLKLDVCSDKSKINEQIEIAKKKIDWYNKNTKIKLHIYKDLDIKI